MISDGVLLAVLAGACIVTSAVLVRTIRKYKPRWSRAKVALLSALPVPAVLGILPSWVFLYALAIETTSPQDCGVDACAMARLAAFIAVACLIGLFLLGALIGWLMQVMERR